jgi:ribonuclease HI
MELMAVVQALKKALQTGSRQVIVHTDSSYVKNGVTQWMYNWEKRGWKTSQGTDVKNKIYWKALLTLVDKFLSIEWVWVKAHNGDPMNEKVDRLARDTANLIKKNFS